MGKNPMCSPGCYAIVASILKNESSIIEDLDFSVSQRIPSVCVVTPQKRHISQLGFCMFGVGKYLLNYDYLWLDKMLVAQIFSTNVFLQNKNFLGVT